MLHCWPPAGRTLGCTRPSSRLLWRRYNGNAWPSFGSLAGTAQYHVDLIQSEESCFWRWALVDILNETGVRNEGLVTYALFENNMITRATTAQVAGRG
ncbi:hypothetical protein D9M68_971590 [compost metagenome]